MLVTHSAIVSKVSQGCVEVVFSVDGGCRTCEAASHCGMVESTRRHVAVATEQWELFHVGDEVELSVSESAGMKAVAVAYLLPALILVAVCLLLASVATELWAIAGALLSVALYWILLRVFRHHTEKKYSFAIHRVE